MAALSTELSRLNSALVAASASIAKPAKKKTYNEKGYVRIWHGEHRGKYEHRVVMAELCKVFSFWPLDPKTGLPEGMVVHHIDHVRDNNAHSNLMLLDPVIHNAISHSRQAFLEAIQPTDQYTFDEARAIREEHLVSDKEVSGLMQEMERDFFPAARKSPHRAVVKALALAK